MQDIQRVNKNFYDKYAQQWSRNRINSFWHESQFRKFIRYFHKGDKILDIGCANGIHVPLFLGVGRGIKYEGIDISSGLLKIARSRYPQLKFLKANILDVKALPRKKHSGFWAAAIFMHIPESDWPKLVRNIESTVKPRGVGYLTLPRQRPNLESRKDQRYFSYWTPRKAKIALQKYRWKVLAGGEMPERTASWFWMIVRLPK